MTPAARRAAVTVARDAHGISERRACSIIGADRSAIRYRHRRSTTGMAPNRLRAATASDPHLIAPALAAWLSAFRSCFTAPVWNRVLVLVAGAVLAPGKAHRHPGAARHGAGCGAAVPSLP